MGQVIQIKDKEATRVSATDPVLTFIDECYGRLGQLGDFVERNGQKDLSYAVCKALVAGEPLAAQAPTGTGKTIAYLVGAVAAAEKLRGIKDVPVVVATATVGLQSQIIHGDIPRLVRAGILQGSDSLLAKGRGRYFCIAEAERQTSGKSATSQVDFFDEEANTQAIKLSEVQELLTQWNDKGWTGDIDAYPSQPPTAWRAVAASSDTCLGYKCDHYNACPFFNARRALSSAKVIVANHDLVFSDLTMAKDGQDPLFPGSKYLLVFDEAHHVPDKAVEAGSAQVNLHELLEELPKLAAFTKHWERQVEFARLLEKAKLNTSDFDSLGLQDSLEHAISVAKTYELEEGSAQRRFEKGVVPSDLLEPLRLAAEQCEFLRKSVQEAVQALKQSNLSEKSALLKAAVAEVLYHGASANGKLGELLKALHLFTASNRSVRWLYVNQDGQVHINTAPLDGSEVLRELLWNSERVNVCFMSATLQDFDGFDRFKSRAGAPDSLRTKSLPHIFPYEKCQLAIAPLKYTPKQEERKEFMTELRLELPRHINPKEGTLVLFPSREMMNELTPVLKSNFGAHRLLCQNEKGIKELVAEHKLRIDKGQGSILCGLATMAEGLDLPGVYCTHVVVCALPFTAPTSPVERELQEELGPRYFAERALPDTLVKLTQMVGRLMRRESDRGRITVFDKRLTSTKWGQKMLYALPNFNRVWAKPLAWSEPPADADTFVEAESRRVS